METNETGFLTDERGVRSTGRLLAWICIGAAILTFWLGIFKSDAAPHAYKAGVALLIAGWAFYSGGKGLEQVSVWIQARFSALTAKLPGGEA